MNSTLFPERLSHLTRLREGAAGRLLPIHSEDAQAALDRIEALEKERPCNGLMIADDKGGITPFCNLKQRIEALEAELTAYTDAALYDAMMDGPRFKGWNRSQLDRARRITEARDLAQGV